MTSDKHICRGCGRLDDGPFRDCICEDDDMTIEENQFDYGRDDPGQSEEKNMSDNIIPGPGHAGDSEPVNDPGANDQPALTKEQILATQKAEAQRIADDILGEAPTEDTVDSAANEPQQPAQPDEATEAQVAFGVHLILTTDGSFAIQATGEPNLGEMQMIVSRGLKSIEARMIAETIMATQAQAKSEKRIITPGRG